MGSRVPGVPSQPTARETVRVSIAHRCHMRGRKAAGRVDRRTNVVVRMETLVSSGTRNLGTVEASRPKSSLFLWNT